MASRARSVPLLALFGTAALLAACSTTPAQTPPGVATVTGTALIVDAPAGWHDTGFYVQACPAPEPFIVACPGGVTGTPSGSHVVDSGQTLFGDSTTAPPGGQDSYTVLLATSGRWWIGLYYYTDYGQIIEGAPVTVTARGRGVIHRDLTETYTRPTVAGLVELTGAPADFSRHAYMGVQACPGTGVFGIGCRDGRQDFEGVLPGHAYSIDLPPGQWTVAAYYRPDDNSRLVIGTPVDRTATDGLTATGNLTVGFRGL
jgi:hypothetical protein